MTGVPNRGAIRKHPDRGGEAKDRRDSIDLGDGERSRVAVLDLAQPNPR
jgi:hypothetical protein